jgi:hypothetical protein
MTNVLEMVKWRECFNPSISAISLSPDRAFRSRRNRRRGDSSISFVRALDALTAHFRQRTPFANGLFAAMLLSVDDYHGVEIVVDFHIAGKIALEVCLVTTVCLYFNSILAANFLTCLDNSLND